MALSFFADKCRPPSDDDLTRCLGRAAGLWRHVRADVAARHPKMVAEWGYTSRNTGWGLRLKIGKRVILYMTPDEGRFLASLALGEKAATSDAARRLPPALKRLVDAAPRYAEGRGIRLAVSRPSDARGVAKLVALKLLA